jgi:hypothetical protein
LYIPEVDFKLIAAQINPLLSNIQSNICSTGNIRDNWGECKIEKTCEEIARDYELKLNITV